MLRAAPWLANLPGLRVRPERTGVVVADHHGRGTWLRMAKKVSSRRRKGLCADGSSCRIVPSGPSIREARNSVFVTGGYPRSKRGAKVNRAWSINRNRAPFGARLLGDGRAPLQAQRGRARRTAAFHLRAHDRTQRQRRGHVTRTQRAFARCVQGGDLQRGAPRGAHREWRIQDGRSGSAGGPVPGTVRDARGSAHSAAPRNGARPT